MIGLGVMIQELSDNEEAVKLIQSSIGQTITSVTMKYGDDPNEYAHNNRNVDYLEIQLETGLKIGIYDAGQSCCESRYMRCDDDILPFIGSKLLSIETRDVETVQDDEYDRHDIQFLLINTDKGTLTVNTHNVHNGYYGGFSISVFEVV